MVQSFLRSASPDGTSYGLEGSSWSTQKALTNQSPGTPETNITEALPKTGGTMLGWVAPSVPTLVVSESSVAVNAALGNSFNFTISTSGLTIQNPTNPVDGQVIRFRLTQGGSGSYSVTWANLYDFGTGSAPTLSASVGKLDIVAFEYAASIGKWIFLGASLGYTHLPISWVDYASVQGSSSPLTLTIPNDAAVGDVVVIGICGQGVGNQYLTWNVAFSGTSTLTQPAPTEQGLIGTSSQVWVVQLEEADLGKAVTVTTTGSVNVNLLSGVMGMYNNAQLPVDAILSSTSVSGATSYVVPTVSTTAPNDWLIEIVAMPANTGLTMTPSGDVTGRSPANNQIMIADSNGSVGGAGTSIGGGTWSENGGAVAWHAWTIALPQA